MTRFTAAPGMLVRKGSYIFRSANGIALLTEVRGVYGGTWNGDAEGAHVQVKSQCTTTTPLAVSYASLRLAAC